MALALRLRALQGEIVTTYKDITEGLTSLQFENTFSTEKNGLNLVRARNHAIFVTRCALTTVIVDIIQETRKLIKDRVQQFRQSAAVRDCNKSEADDTLTIGIIGCGHLGSLIANCLLTYGQIHPKRLKISTRRPELLEDLQSQGVDCFFDNPRLTSSAHVIILCVLPSHIAAVADDIRDLLSPAQLVLCHGSSCTPRKLSQVLKSTNVIVPQLTWSEANTKSPESYKYSIDIITALADRQRILDTCPFGVKQEDLIVSTDPRLTESLILAVVNMCTERGLTKDLALTIVHAAVFGESERKRLQCEKLESGHFGISMESKIFPHFSLVDEDNTMSLFPFLQGNKQLQAAFVSRYCRFFENYNNSLLYGPATQ